MHQKPSVRAKDELLPSNEKANTDFPSPRPSTNLPFGDSDPSARHRKRKSLTDIEHGALQSLEGERKEEKASTSFPDTESPRSPRSGPQPKRRRSRDARHEHRNSILGLIPINPIEEEGVDSLQEDPSPSRASHVHFNVSKSEATTHTQEYHRSHTKRKKKHRSHKRKRKYESKRARMDSQSGSSSGSGDYDYYGGHGGNDSDYSRGR